MMDEIKIREGAKKIMDEFVSALDRAEHISEFGEEREENVRGKLPHRDEKGFRERMFRNALKKNDDFIVAEKKKW